MTSSQKRVLKKKITCYNCKHLKGPHNTIPKGSRHIEETYVCNNEHSVKCNTEVGKILIDTFTGSRNKSRNLTEHTECVSFESALGKFEGNEFVREEEVKNKLTDEEYIEHGGTKCPHCQSDEISTVDCVKVELGCAFQDIVCNDCKEVWTDLYKLTGYSNEE